MRLRVLTGISGAVLLVSLTAPHASAVLPVQPITITVNNAGDAGDINISNDVCNTVLHGTVCTLRAAIQTANHHAETTGADAIHFAIGTGGVTIKPGAVLPTITDQVTIDGTTQPGSSGTCLAETGHPCVELEGELLGSTGVGLRIDAGKTAVRGLVVNRFQDAGIVLETAGGDAITGNLIGTDPTGTSGLGNHVGVRVESGAADVIGGKTAAARNVISGNGIDGVELDSAGSVSDTGPNLLQNFPSITSAVTANGSTAIQGKLTSKAGTKFVLRLYSSASCDPSGFGEGAAFLGQLAVLTGANGSVTLGFAPPSPVAAGKQITATATDPKGNTSEFSKCRAVTAG